MIHASQNCFTAVLFVVWDCKVRGADTKTKLTLLECEDEKNNQELH